MEGWSEFFLGELGAAAAVAGLFVVAITINVERILQSKFLPGRAALTLIVIGAAVTLSGIALFPRQPLSFFGWESIAGGAVTIAAGIRHTVAAYRGRGKTDPYWWSYSPLILIAVCAVPWLIGGTLMVGGSDAGVYWIASGVLVSMVTTLMTGWVLLIEILR
jgi:modulator of FtsH protease